jgi:hypothetical protein
MFVTASAAVLAVVVATPVAAADIIVFNPLTAA